MNSFRLFPQHPCPSSFSRMSTESPHTLQKLAIQSLLRDEALAMEAVEDLPGELFPPVFMEAFTRGHAEVLKAMVLAWPFPCLPLGALMEMRTKGTLDTQEDAVQVQERMLQAVLEGIHVLLSQKVCCRTLKLQVLDMRVMHQNFWRVWAENKLEGCSSAAMKRRKTEMSVPRGAKNQPPRVIVDLWINDGGLHPVQFYLLKWVQEREDLVQLECEKLCITGLCPQWIKEFLAMLNVDSVQGLDVGHCWTFFEFAQFACFLGQMKNLHKLIISDISVPTVISPERREDLFNKITSQFLKLHSLQEIYMDSVDFLEGHLDEVLRCLKCPLEILSLTHCQLSHSDWNQLPQAEQTRKLKHLDLSCIRLTHFSTQPLRILLDNVAATLTILRLENCGITDAQVCAFLPSLSCCSQLTTFCFIRNFISIATMKKLLDHTARLRNLKKELYSVPPEVDVPRHGTIQQMRNEAHEALRRMMKPLNHPRTIWFCVLHELCCNRALYNMRPKPCPASAQAEQTRQLKYLDLSCIRLTDFNPEPLGILLDNVAATLTTLNLENCGITDAQVCAFLPSLSCCSQLTTFCFVWNFISTGTMKKLLVDTARLRNLNMELYSVLQEVFVPRHGAHKHMWKQIHEALRRVMKPLNLPRRVWFCVHHEPCCDRALNNLCPSPCQFPQLIPLDTHLFFTNYGITAYLRMSRQSPAPLYDLAKQSLLKRETTASTALHGLPSMIFHDLFMDAFMGEHNEVLKMMLEVFHKWDHENMKAFFSQLKKMKNLHTFHFNSLSPGVYTSPSKNQSYSRIYALHLGQLESLRELHMDAVFFLEGTLHKILRSQTPLESLSLNSSPLKESDLQHMSQCASTSQLKSLTLRRISMKLFSPETLHVLLHKLSSTLETLVLEHCDITDPQLLAILPALSCCSQLKTFSCYGNHFSLSSLHTLLHLNSRLSQLTQGLYPAPLEIYESNSPTSFMNPP
ncbi:PREDICTED: uncharacterized protein LOC102012969 [Chinchilla lanigera]|uniref:uncharacterized protein LOC102012969 n=1 Tax=Chinchilla lanigera TaxID=34839 RepID=UPI000695FB6A|nr:PREDICTED: uncharacterized protein LOC102012969 [Chinchilla lanigera]